MIDPLSGFPPNVTVDAPARHLLARLTPGVRRLISRLVEVMQRTANQSAVPISRTEISVDQDPEDGTEKIEIRQWVRGPEVKALDVWDRIGHEVEDWANGLSDLDAEALTEYVTFAVYADADDAAA